jgi:hypothetical protein
MSELDIIIPPPRPDSGAALTIALALAVALHAIPLLAAPEEEPVPIDTDIGITCTFSCEPEDQEPPAADKCRSDLELFRDPWLTREMAIEQALVGPDRSYHYVQPMPGGHGLLGGSQTPPLVPRFPPETVERGEFVLEASEWFGEAVWRVRDVPQLARSMRPRPPATDPEIMVIYARGPRDKATLKRYVKRHRAELARCASGPSLSLRTTTGERTVLVQFVVDPEGRVTDTDVQGEHGDLGACVQRTIAAIRFPRFSTTELTQVNLPLRYGTTVASAGVFVR